MRALRILVVDDFEGMRESICDILTSFGHTVATAASGDEALSVLSQSPYPIDVLVTDLEMPRMGGVELWRHVHSLVPNARVLFLSGHHAEMFQGNQLLPGDVLTKPPDLRRLEQFLQSIQSNVSP